MSVEVELPKRAIDRNSTGDQLTDIGAREQRMGAVNPGDLIGPLPRLVDLEPVSASTTGSYIVTN